MEQTQDSTRLDRFEFPAKTVLILGNEKEGIPIELIQVKTILVENSGGTGGMGQMFRV